jgi:DNA polymerase III delta prime subunit
MKENSLLVEKFRPTTLENYICKDEYKQKFQEYIDKQDIPMLLFAGAPGSGKTTIAKLLVKNINCDYIYLNAADERSIDVMRDKVGSFAAAGSFKPLKVVILDEATHILEVSQVVLLNMMETYSLNTRFILTGNYPERLIEPLRSRLQEFDLQPPSKKIVAQHVSNILDKEKTEYKLQDLATIINKSYPDFRKIINNCQKYTVGNKLVLNDSINISNDYKEKILDEFKKPSSKTFNNIRQIIANAGVGNFEELYRFLYDNVSIFASKNIGEAIISIEEYRYRSTSRVDQEITFCALIYKLIEIIK